MHLPEERSDPRRWEDERIRKRYERNFNLRGQNSVSDTSIVENSNEAD